MEMSVQGGVKSMRARERALLEYQFTREKSAKKIKNVKMPAVDAPPNVTSMR